MNQKTFHRRIFLRGLGGAVVAAPFLSSVAEKEVGAQTAASEPIRRLIVMFTHYGCITNRWFPEKSHGELTQSDYEKTTLKHLAPFANKLLMPRGLRSMNEWNARQDFGQNNDPHTQVMGSYFTCHPVTPESDKFGATPTGRSLDHIAAEQVNPGGAAPLVVGIGGASSSAMQAFSYSAPGKVFPGIGSPDQIFGTLTQLYQNGGPPQADSYALARGRTLVDVVRQDLESLELVPMSGSDQRKIKDWKDLLVDTGKAVGALCSQEIAEGTLGLTPAAVKAASAGGGIGGVDLSKSTDVMLDLIVLATLCDQNRIIFSKFPGNITFKWDGMNHPKENHSLSHRIGNANQGGDKCVDNVIDLLTEMDDWYAKKFAYLVGRLDSFDEGDRKVLDNTATIWFQEMSDGNAHNLNNMPILQAGSCSGYFKVGQAVNLEGGGATLSRGNSDHFCKVPGENIPLDDLNGTVLDASGTDKTIANRPINKYYCNLLNAIGVRAGQDGFPAVGGENPVTRFGKHDVSKDFADPDNPAGITDPDEYAELRANA